MTTIHLSTEVTGIQRLLHIVLTDLINATESPDVYVRLRETSRRTGDADSLVALFRTVYLLTRNEQLSPSLDTRLEEIYQTITYAARVGSYRLIDWSRLVG